MAHCGARNFLEVISLPTCVTRGSKVGMMEEREGRGGWIFPLFFRYIIKNEIS
jgi:hypothetical protein